MVYCSMCKFYKSFSDDVIMYVVHDTCTHNHNKTFYGNYAYNELIYKKNPSEINKKNDCLYYKPKFSVRILKFFLTIFGK